MKETLILSVQEKQSPLWIRIEKHLNERLASLRAKNDGDLDQYQTATMRGRIAEVKALIDLGKDKPIIE